MELSHWPCLLPIAEVVVPTDFAAAISSEGPQSGAAVNLGLKLIIDALTISEANRWMWSSLGLPPINCIKTGYINQHKSYTCPGQSLGNEKGRGSNFCPSPPQVLNLKGAVTEPKHSWKGVQNKVPGSVVCPTTHLRVGWGLDYGRSKRFIPLLVASP